MAKKATAKNVSEVLENLAKYISEHDLKTRRWVAGQVNEFLDELSTHDFFGTEGQLDPRGDQRD